MSKRFFWINLVAVLALLALLAGLFVGSAEAAPPADAQTDGLRIDGAAMQSIADFSRRAEAHLVRNADGTVRFTTDDAAALGVTAKFLADYKAALEHINAEIRAGALVVKADGSLAPNVDAAAAPAQPAARSPKLPAGAQLVENPTAEQLAKARPAEATEGGVDNSPDWNVRNYNNTFYVTWTSYDAYYYRYYPYHYSWPAAMAAYVGYPYISPRLVYLFTYSYNWYYFSQCTYPYGSVWYIPWRYLCQTCGHNYYYVYFQVRYIYYYYGYYYYTYGWRPYSLYF